MTTSSAIIASSIATFRAQVLGSMMNLGTGDQASFSDILSKAAAGSSNSALASNTSLLDMIASGAPSSGQSMPLYDPQSANRMMTTINRLEVTYKGQYAELNQMESALPQLASAASQISNIGVSDSNDSIKAKLLDFAKQYNAWVQQFKPDVAKGGVLDNVQAGEIPLWELDQVVESPFIGAKEGISGLASIGISIDGQTGLMSVNTDQLDTALGSNKQSVVAALNEFAAKFADEANLLASGDNVVQHRLSNLSAAIGYIDGNVVSWRQEFGAGDAAVSAGKVAQALNAYQSSSRI